VNHPGRKLIALLSSTTPGKLRETEQLVTSLGLRGSVELRVGQPSSEKDYVLSRSRLLVLPSYEEGWSLTAMEAARAGVPIICYDLSAYDYLNGGLLTAHTGDTLELVKCIERVWNDPSTTALLVETASKAIEVYDASRLADIQLGEFLDAWTRRNKKKSLRAREIVYSTGPAEASLPERYKSCGSEHTTRSCPERPKPSGIRHSILTLDAGHVAGCNTTPSYSKERAHFYRSTKSHERPIWGWGTRCDILEKQPFPAPTLGSYHAQNISLIAIRPKSLVQP
jgi:hypothetical protein